MITSCTFVFVFLQLMLVVFANYQGAKFCPKLTLNSGEPLDLGCFDNYTNYVATYYPEMAEDINATYAFYWRKNASTPFREWRYDESFQNETEFLMNPNSHLAFIIHGFTDDSDAEWVFNMTDALLNLGAPSERHVITVDWRQGAEGPNYVQAAMNIFMLGRLTADFIFRLMQKYRLNADKIHLIGHSLGGQAVGAIADWLHNRFHTTVGRSTGLDVAAPGFESSNIWPNKWHTKFLEIIHTSSGNEPVTGSLGIQNNFGHVDLYPNGGVVPQPGCPAPPFQIGCSHSAAKTIYIDILLNCVSGCRYIGRDCDSVTDAVNKNCTGHLLDICQRIEFLRLKASDSMSNIIYMDTTAQDSPDRCETHFEVEEPSFLVRVFENIMKSLYRLLGFADD